MNSLFVYCTFRPILSPLLYTIFRICFWSTFLFATSKQNKHVYEVARSELELQFMTVMVFYCVNYQRPRTMINSTFLRPRNDEFLFL